MNEARIITDADVEPTPNVPWTCIYCGRHWPETDPVALLQGHIIECEVHPAGRLFRALENLVEAAPTFAQLGAPMPPSWQAASDLLDELKAARA